MRDRANLACRFTPYLLRKMQIVRPNQVWCADITFVPVKHGFLYLVAIMDWRSRKVLSWRLATGNGNRWTKERITALRSYRKIPVFKPDPGGLDPWLNLSSAAKLLGVAPKTLRLAAETGEIEADHPLADGPWVFARAELSKTAAQQLRKRAQKNPKHPAVSRPDQKNLFSSTT